MIKALDTIGTKRMNSKTTEIQKTIAEKVKITAFNQPIDRIPSVDCLWIPIFAEKRAARMTGIAASVNKLSGKTIERVLKSGDFNGKLGETLVLRDIVGVTSKKILLVGLGQESKLDGKAFARAICSAIRTTADSSTIKKALSFLAQVKVKGRNSEWLIKMHVSESLRVLYKFERFKTEENGAKKDGEKKLKPDDISLKSLQIAAPGNISTAESSRVIRDAICLANGVELTRDLGNLPPNICTPGHIRDVASRLAKETKLKCEIFDKKKLEKLGMGSFLAVAQGSVQPPYMVVLTHNGGKAKEAPIVLVGKGITFDSGGISIKPSAAMDEMKYDMCGAATVLGLMKTVAESGIKKNVIGVVVTCENMPSGTATRPGDIVTSKSGRTIEILNTDAEGRLILCDALTYVERFKPKAVIDIATLTGACVIALGGVNTGLFSADDHLATALTAAGRRSLDPAWRLPLEEEYQDLINSPFADVANVGGREAGSVTAACFLWRFAKNYPWAHLDIAGTAWLSGSKKNATGRPVPLLWEFVSEY